MTEECAMNYPLNRAFALKNVAIEKNPWGRVIYDTDGYIAQEIKSLKEKKGSPDGKRA